MKKIIVLSLFLLGATAATNSLFAQAAVASMRENILYIGIDNPLKVAVADAPLSAISVTATGCGCTLTGSNGSYVARVSQPGLTKIKVFVTKNDEKSLVDSALFRVKRIPAPRVALNDASSGAMTAAEFQAFLGIRFVYDNFDADIQPCTIQSFVLTLKLPNDNSPMTVKVAGAGYNAAALQLCNQAVSGAVYYFDDITARCYGDDAARKLNAMVWKIR
jgi:hypothetical protein